MCEMCASDDSPCSPGVHSENCVGLEGSSRVRQGNQLLVFLISTIDLTKWHCANVSIVYLMAYGISIRLEVIRFG